MGGQRRGRRKDERRKKNEEETRKWRGQEKNNVLGGANIQFQCPKNCAWQWVGKLA